MDPVVSPERRQERAEVLVATTWHCNLRCSYCFVQECELAAPGQRMSRDLAARVIDSLDDGFLDVETVCVHLYGGEPLTNLPAAEAMLERVAGKAADRFSFAITTNGTCLSQAAIDLLQAGSFEVILSIDGPAEIHDECRRTPSGGPTHARVSRFLDAVRSQTDCQVRGSSVVRSGWTLSQAVDYLRGLPVHAIKAQAVRGPAGAPYALTEDEKKGYLADLEEVGRQVVSDLEAGRVPRDDRFSGRVLQLLAGVDRDAFCAAGDTTFGITPSGDVLPCLLLDSKDCHLGNVNDVPAAWREAGRCWRRARPKREECKTCSSFPLCGGGCPALIPICGTDECDIIRKNCDVAISIYRHFQESQGALLTLAGIR